MFAILFIIRKPKYRAAAAADETALTESDKERKL